MTLKIKDKVDQGLEHCRSTKGGCIDCPYHMTSDGEVIPTPKCFYTLTADMKKIMNSYEMQINMLSEALEEYERAEFEKPKVKARAIHFKSDGSIDWEPAEDESCCTFTFEMDKLGEKRDE